MRRSTLAATLVVAFGLACTDEPAPVGVEEPVAHEATASLVPCDPSLATHIRDQIVLLFPRGKSLRQAAQSQFDNIARKCLRVPAEAQAKARSLVSFTIEKHQNEQLTSAATPQAVADFLTDVLAYVGLGAADVVTVVEPSTSEQTVTTANGEAGASFPPGAVSQSIVVSIAPSADQTDPLPTGLTQFPPFYDFVTSPAVTFDEPVTIGICVNHGGLDAEVLARLQLARPDVTGGTTLELLPRVAAPFLDCPALPGLTVASASLVDRLLTAAARVVRPAALHAAALVQIGEIGGLGGTVGNFGDNPVGTVDPAPPEFTSLGAGYSHTCGLTPEGTVYCWGFNQSGRLGDGTTTSHATPVAVQMPAGVTFASLAVGAGFSCGLTVSGLPYCWGENFYGQVGDGSTTDRFTPVPVVMPSGVVFAGLSAFGAHVCGLTAAGAAYCWGYNFYGQLGDGTTANQATPVAVLMPAGVTSFSAIRAGESHTCGRAYEGLYCWGGNWLGQLGDGTTIDRSMPVAVAEPGLGITAWLAGGGGHTCGVTPTGAAYCWGWNTSGQLGNGTFANALLPTAVVFPAGVDSLWIDAGGVHTCGLTHLGAAYCWGDNRDGQLGNGTTTNQSTIVAVQMPTGITFTLLSLSAYHSCALTPAGKAYCWGDNWAGQLGDGTTTDRWIPTPVAH